MRLIVRVAVCMSVLICLAMPLSADGGGGLSWGNQVSKIPFIETNIPLGNGVGLSYWGGFGYGISGRFRITGGFGYVVHDPTGESGLWGGFGGVINGIRILKWPVNLSLVSYTAFGGIHTGAFDTDFGRGFFALAEEIDLEVGIPIFRWFMPTVFIGYQIAGNMVPGTPFRGFFSYTPVIGFRMQWGKFY